MRDLDYVFSHGEETRQWLTRAYAFLPDPFVCWRSTWNEYFPYIAMSDECDMGLDGDRASTPTASTSETGIPTRMSTAANGTFFSNRSVTSTSSSRT